MIMKGQQQQLDMDKWIEKGDVLIEALPYIQRFNRKIIVVKYGGSAMLDENFMKSVIQANNRTWRRKSNQPSH